MLSCLRQAKDIVASAKGLYTQFLSDDVFFVEYKALVQQCDRALVRARTSGFENWICRIALGGAKCKARSPGKALTAKHKVYMSYDNCDAAKEVFPALWAIGLPLIGTES
jgi:hypothetical protein